MKKVYIHGVRFERAAATIAEQCPALRARQASRALARVYDEALRPLGLQSSQLTVLVAVAMHGKGGAPIGRVAQVLVMDRTTLTRNVRPLERAGLLQIARSAEDARTRVVVLTKAGERLLELAYPVWERVTKSVRRSMGERGFAGLHAHFAAAARVKMSK